MCTMDPLRICLSKNLILWIGWLVGLVIKLCLTLVTPWTVACLAFLSMGFSSQEYWSGLPFPSPGNLPPTVLFPLPSLPLTKQLTGEFRYINEIWTTEKKKWRLESIRIHFLFPRLHHWAFPCAYSAPLPGLALLDSCWSVRCYLGYL